MHASVKEGWGLIVIEATNQAILSVVYNVAGLQNSVRNNITGIVLEDNSAEEMVKQAVELIKDKKITQLFKNGLLLVQNLTWERETQRKSGPFGRGKT